MENNLNRMAIFKKGLQLTFNPQEILTDIFKLSKGRSLYLWVLQAIEIASFFIVFTNGAFHFAPDYSLIPVLSLIAGVTEIFSVVADADGKLSNYFWGILNNIFYIWVSFDSHLYGEVYLNLLFLVIQFVGIYLWYRKNVLSHTNQPSTVQVKSMSGAGWLILILITLISWG